jgi:hypothetical protein
MFPSRKSARLRMSRAVPQPLTQFALSAPDQILARAPPPTATAFAASGAAARYPEPGALPSFHPPIPVIDHDPRGLGDLDIRILITSTVPDPRYKSAFTAHHNNPCSRYWKAR